jgi:uncharacterized protein (TIGR04141 family)
MANTYNIYKVKSEKFEQLKEKLKSVGLIEQKTLERGGYKKTFYFSEKVEGNDVWWWETYRDFFNENIEEPKNIFNFAVLICQNIKLPKKIFAVSLGKSHFYLSKFIQLDFGIDLALHMADESSILLKKSRYFTGTKRQDVSSYQQFQVNNYEAGESVDHIKLKAANKTIWGNRNIIFADSIQMDMDKQPIYLPEIFKIIDACLKDDKIIHLPKLESTNLDISNELDSQALIYLRDGEGNVGIDQFYVSGVSICFSFHDYDYVIKAKSSEGKIVSKKLGNALDIKAITEFLIDYPDILDINNVTIQFKSEDSGSFTKSLKEVLDIPILWSDQQYFLKNGEWFFFNQVFMDYLKRSLNTIKVVLEEKLIEKDFTVWQAKKRADAKADADKVDYREAYFNQKICNDRGYNLLDRELTAIRSLEKKKRDYRVEIADLYHKGEIISVKISKKKTELIYNIEQSKDSITLIKNNQVKFNKKLTSAALWFVFEEDIKTITEVNSIQFLLAVEAWRKLVVGYSLEPKIYISQHIR